MQWDDQKYEFLKSCLISSEMCQPEVSSHEYLKAFPIKSSVMQTKLHSAAGELPSQGNIS